MKDGLPESRVREEEEEERGREEVDRLLKSESGSRVDDEEEEDLEMMKAASRDQIQRIGGYTPGRACSSSPVLTSSLQRGTGGDVEDEVRVSIVAIEEDESCPSEPFGTAHLQSTNQITRTDDGGVQTEEEDEEVVMSPSDHLQHQVSIMPLSIM